MYLISIHLQNFRQHKDTYIQFVQGLTGILGQNGAGKSTILEGIAWALYGNKSGVLRGNKETLIWRYAPGKSEVIVDLKFFFQKRDYHIQRSVRGTTNTAQLWQDETLIANSTKAVDEKIAQLLRMDHREFFNSYFTGQKELQFLGSIEGATARERFIAKMLGYEKIEEAQGRSDKANTLRYDLKQKEKSKDQLEGYLQSFAGINDRIVQQEAKLKGTTTQLQEIQQKLEEISQTKDKLEPQWHKINVQREQFLYLQNQLQTHQMMQQKLEGEISNLQRRSIEIKEELDKFYQLQQEVSPYKNLQEEYQILTENYQSFLKARQARENLDKLKKEITTIILELQKLKPIEAELSTVLETIQACQTKINDQENQIKGETLAWQKYKAELQAKIDFEKQVLLKAQRQHQTIIDAGEDGICPTCERPLLEEYGNVVDGFFQQITECQHHLSQWQGQGEQLSKTPSSILELEQTRSVLQGQLAEQEMHKQRLSQEKLRGKVLEQQLNLKQQELKNLEQQISSLPQDFNLDHYQVIQTQLNQLRPKYESFLKLAQTPQNFQNLQTQLQQKQFENQNLIEQIEITQNQINSIAFNESDFHKLQEELESIKKNYENIKEEHRSKSQILTFEHQQLQQLQQQLQEYMTKMSELRLISSEYLTLKELDKAFSALSKYLTEQIRPRLAQSASYFLHQLTEGRYDNLYIDEKYQVVVQDQGQDKPVISGGEEDIVNLSLRLAISQMITERSGQPFSLLILDEVFGSLDQNHRDNVMQLLHRLEQQFEQVLIITHIEDIKESLNQVIRLAFDSDKQHTVILTE